MPYNDPDILMAMEMLSIATEDKRLPEFFLAWFIEEHGWDAAWPKSNNPFNISTAKPEGEVWFNGMKGIEPNAVVEYDNMWYGLAATLSLVQSTYPVIFSASEDLQAMDAWAAGNPQYAANIENIYRNPKLWEAYAKPMPPNIAPAPVTNAKTYTVKSGDTLWNIAIQQCHKPGSYWSYLAKINHITNASALQVGQVIQLG